MSQYIDEYLSSSHWRKKENSNTNESFSNLTNYVVSKMFANDFLMALPREHRDAHENGILHIHNLETGGYVPYSYNKQTPVIIKRNNKKLIVAIQDILIGDYVLDEAGVKFTRVSNVIFHDSHCDLLRIKLSNGSLIEVTEDHPIIMHCGLQTKQAKDLKIGDLVQGCNVSKRNFSFDGYEISRKLAWLIGVYIAEGNLTNSSYRITQEEGIISNKILNYLNDLSLHYWITKDDNRNRFNIYNKQMETMPFITIKEYAKNKNIPYESLTLQSYFDIISGIIDGDGTRKDSKFATVFEISSQSYELVHQIKLIFDVVRIYSSIRYDNSCNIYRIEFYLREQQLSLFRESVKVNSEPIIYFKGSKNLDYFSKEVKVISIDKVAYIGNLVADITTDTHTFCSMGLKLHNCCGHNLKFLLLYGMKTPSISSKPAKHLNSLMDHVMNWLYCSQMEFAGAQSFSDFDTLVAPFIKKEKLGYKDVKQQLQKLIFNLNFTMRSSSQTPFTNLSLNVGVPKFLVDEPAIIGGEEAGFSYGDCINESYMIVKAIAELMSERDVEGRPFTFPVLTLNLNGRFQWDSELANVIAKNCATMGSFYFMNYLGSGIQEDIIRSMCCRLSLKIDQLSGPKGMWNTSDGTGSMAVVTVNLPRLAYDVKGKDEKVLFEELERRLEMALFILKARKDRIKKHMKSMMPFNMANGWSMKNYFMTIGLLGFNEFALNYVGKDITDNGSVDLVKKVLNYIKEWSLKRQHELGELINVEMVPGEGCGYRLAKVDRKLSKDIVTLGDDKAPYYSTLFIPPSIGMDTIDRIMIEEKILQLFSGGTIFRTFIGEKEPSKEAVLDYIKLVAGSKIPYFDITTTYAVCTKDGSYIRGNVETCPKCQSPTDVYSRVVGYYRAKSKYNIGKRKEFEERKYINLE